ncbi:MAG: phosphate ABC transporter substrate-binding protein PstS [Caulobacteraceae bacterium]|nr:phosphate ABC transporter substrate-binding protein PstS [Caulobacteraceae bacterium]
MRGRLENGHGRRSFLAGVVVAASEMLIAAAPAPVVLRGVGSTFAAPILSKWVSGYMATYHPGGGVKVVYQAVGSGAGIDAIKAGKADFAASDKPLPPGELARAGLGQFPLVIGGIVPVVNVPGVGPGKLRFTGALLADIYLGKITHWNDRAIAALNPGVVLPATPIAVVHRSDGSGTTFNWADYLAKSSPEWKARVGEGTSVAWPVGAGAPGNDGVSVLVRKTAGAIGYVEWAYVIRDRLAWAYVRNRAGQYVRPGSASFAAAAQDVNWDAAKDFYLVLTDAPGPRAYPITATTFVLARKHATTLSAEQSRALRQLFEWAFFNGQSEATALGYVPLPRNLTTRIEAYWIDEFPR